jgi:hypothetical protein
VTSRGLPTGPALVTVASGNGEGSAVQLVMSVIVLLAGLFVALVADAPADLRVFGWVLVAVGLLGVAVAALSRRRPR